MPLDQVDEGVIGFFRAIVLQLVAVVSGEEPFILDLIGNLGQGFIIHASFIDQ